MTKQQQKTHPDDAHPDKLIGWARNVFIGAITVVGLLILIYIFVFKDEPKIIDVEKWGQVGDFLGGTLNPLIGGATVFYCFLDCLFSDEN